MNYPNLSHVIDVIAKLRHPKDGCPWDLEQNHKSLTKYLIEESYEYIHAVEENDYAQMENELGDVFLQVLLNAQIGSEGNHFDIESISKVLAEKMIRRHPHVFQDNNIAKTSDEVVSNWEKIKNKEKEGKKTIDFHIRKEHAYAPSLTAANIIGAKSNEVNFDWDDVSDVLKKVDEELAEVKVEMIENNQDRLNEEIGDLLFSVAQLARHLKIDPEQSLKEANLKFIKRVNLVEKMVKEDGLEMKNLPTHDLEGYWQKVKAILKS